MNAPSHRILIVDDEPDIRSILGQICDDHSIPYCQAGSGAEALKVFDENKDIVAVVSDILMPNGNGMELLIQLRDRGSRIPFAFLTSFETDELVAEAKKHGVQIYMTKPFDLSVAEATLLKIVELGKSLLSP